jgi:hypothetical protein
VLFCLLEFCCGLSVPLSESGWATSSAGGVHWASDSTSLASETQPQGYGDAGGGLAGGSTKTMPGELEPGLVLEWEQNSWKQSET